MKHIKGTRPSGVTVQTLNCLRLEHPDNGNIDDKILPNVYSSTSVNVGFHLKTEYRFAKSCQYFLENLMNYIH